MKTLVVKSRESLRVDKFIQQNEPGLSFGLLQKYVRQNKIKVNGKKVPLSTRLSIGDTIQLYLPNDPATKASPGHTATALTVLFEDDFLLAAYKPAGLLSLSEDDSDDSLEQRARRYLKTTSPDAEALLCHRLDTGTSGVLLVAKTTETRDFIGELIRQQTLHKTYYGLVLGHPPAQNGLLNGWLLKNATTGVVRVVAPRTPGAKPAETRYETLKTSDPLALLQLSPKTGRTHQLRAHLATMGTPLLGDSKYGDNTANRRYRCRYQCLCAGEIQFPAIVGEFSRYSNLTIACEKPWFYTQLLDGTLR